MGHRAGSVATSASFSGDLLVGNFGDGHGSTPIAWVTTVGRSHGQSSRARIGRPIEIDGLWGIGFGNGVSAGPTNTLFFAAGPDEETHGLFGSITAP